MNDKILRAPECETGTCNQTTVYRTVSGCCSNIANKDFGRANRAFRRLMESEYDDSISRPRGGINPSKLPSPRKISSVVHRVKETGSKPTLSVMLMQFGQFLDHDITLTPEQGLPIS